MKNKTTNIHIFRAMYGLTQDELAKKMSRSRQSISMIESGETVAGVKLALKLATFFRTSVETLFKINNK